jgi:hypothetical protein
MDPQPAPLTHPHLHGLLADAEGIRAEAERLRDTLTPAQLTWRPAPDVWSVADCFEHVRKVDKGYAARIEEGIGRTASGEGAYAPGFIARSFIRFVSPESTRRLKAPKAIRPKETPPSAGAAALDRFLDQQAALLRLLRAADGRDVNGGRFASPFFGLLKFSVGEGLTLLVRHEQRHLAQALRITAHPDFPAAQA